MICPNCEKEIKNNIAQCPHCGCRFPVKEQPKQPVVNPTTPVKPPINTSQNNTNTVVQGKNCPNCKQTISATATFCKYCGTQMIVKETIIETTQANIKICQSCNKEINVMATFCKWCGTKCGV